MISTAKDIVNIIGGETSLALTPGTDLFFSRMPDTPDSCVVVFDLAAGSPMLTMKQDTSNYYFTGVSIQVRATKYDEAWNQAFDIMQFLHAESNITVVDTYYALIKAESDPSLLEYDQHERPVIFVNFEIQRRPT